MKKSFTTWALEVFWIARLDDLDFLQRIRIVENLTRLPGLIYPVCLRKVTKGSLNNMGEWDKKRMQAKNDRAQRKSQNCATYLIAQLGKQPEPEH